MVKKLSRNRQVAAAMDTDEPATASAEPAFVPLTGQITKPTGMDWMGSGPSESGKQQPGSLGNRWQQSLQRTGKRGQVTTKQRRRKAIKLAKAVAVADRKQSKIGKISSKNSRKATLKGLWTSVQAEP
eukprot:jgi/Botrbrau1/9355/Bobra.354_2s0012.2